MIIAFKNMTYLSKVKFPGSEELAQASERVHILTEISILIIYVLIETNEMLEILFLKAVSRNYR